MGKRGFRKKLKFALRRAVEIVLVIGTAYVIGSAAYIGKGELRGRVASVHNVGDIVVFELEIEEQNVTGVRLAGSAGLLYSGEMMDDIRPGMTLHVWFDGGSDIMCRPCGLFVTRIELPGGAVAEGESRQGLARRTFFDEQSSRRASRLESIRIITGLLSLVSAICLTIQLRRKLT